MTDMKPGDPLVWDYDGAHYRVDWSFAEDIESAVQLALDDAIDAEIDILNIPFCGCDTCVSRTVVAVVIARTIEGIKQGVVERMMEHDWPPELTSDARCFNCGLQYGQWDEKNKWCR